MANIKIAGATYNNVPAVNFKTSTGGTVTFYENGGGTSGSVTVNSKTVTPSSNSTNISFSVEGEPKFFSVQLDAQQYLSTTRTVVNVNCDGNTCYGIYAYSSGYSWMGGTNTLAYSDSYFSYTYSNGTLTISTQSATNGGNFIANAAYRLIYGY